MRHTGVLLARAEPSLKPAPILFNWRFDDAVHIRAPERGGGGEELGRAVHSWHAVVRTVWHMWGDVGMRVVLARGSVWDGWART